MKINSENTIYQQFELSQKFNATELVYSVAENDTNRLQFLDSNY